MHILSEMVHKSSEVAHLVQHIAVKIVVGMLI